MRYVFATILMTAVATVSYGQCPGGVCPTSGPQRGVGVGVYWTPRMAQPQAAAPRLIPFTREIPAITQASYVEAAPTYSPQVCGRSVGPIRGFFRRILGR